MYHHVQLKTTHFKKSLIFSSCVNWGGRKIDCPAAGRRKNNLLPCGSIKLSPEGFSYNPA
jgi:hypothetical protein